MLPLAMRADAADAEMLTIRLLLHCLLARYLQMCNCGNVRVVLFLASSSELSIDILCALYYISITIRTRIADSVSTMSTHSVPYPPLVKTDQRPATKQCADGTNT